MNDLPDGWRWARLADIASKIGSGATPRGGQAVYARRGTSFIRSQNVLDHRMEPEGLVFLDDEASEALRGVAVQPGDVLLNITGDSILRCAVVDTDLLPARVSQHVAIIRVAAELEPILLQRFLTLPNVKAWMLGLSSGGTRKAITKAHIESVQVPVPPHEEQRAIAGVLAAVQDRVASNRRVAGTIRRMVDTLAVVRRPQARIPLREILGDVQRLRWSPTVDDSLVDHFSLPAFDAEVLPERERGSSIKSDKQLITGDCVLISRLNPATDRMWFAIPASGPASVASTEFAVLTPRAGVGLGALWLAVRDPGFRGDLIRRATGTSGSHQRVRSSDLFDIEVPDVRLLAEADGALAEDLLRLAHRLDAGRQALLSFVDTLAPELLSGRIRVPVAA